MDLIQFTSKYKPEGKEYVKVTLWNHYISNKIMLFILILPPLLGFYFLFTGTITTFTLIINLVLILYPVFSVLAFLRKIKKHLDYRNPVDTALTQYTLMDNGILMEQPDFDKLNMKYWHEFDCLYELKDYFVLYYKDSLSLVLDKKDMEGQIDQIRSYILSHLTDSKAKYVKTWLF